MIGACLQAAGDKRDTGERWREFCFRETVKQNLKYWPWKTTSMIIIILLTPPPSFPACYLSVPLFHVCPFDPVILATSDKKQLSSFSSFWYTIIPIIDYKPTSRGPAYHNKPQPFWPPTPQTVRFIAYAVHYNIHSVLFEVFHSEFRRLWN